MTRKEFLIKKIGSKYDNVKDFAREIDIPYSTIRDMVNRFGKSSTENALKVCNALNVKVEDVYKYDE